MKYLMKKKASLLLGVMCLSVVGFTAQSHAAASEGVVRQIAALRSAMDSFADNTRADINTLNNSVNNLNSRVNTAQSEINALESSVNKMNRCGNRGMIYAPNKPNADGQGCVPDSKLSCEVVRWSTPGKKFELSREGGTRFMVHNDPASITRRCKELGYTFGVGNQVFTHREWCYYSNARTKQYTGNNGEEAAAWRNVGCKSNDSVASALCCK